MLGSSIQLGSPSTAADPNAVDYLDDIALMMGDGGTVSIIYETADANANELILALPEGGATDVPVLVIGDTTINNVDLGIFDGITQPSVAIMDKAGKYAAVANATSTGANATLTTATAGTFTNSVAGDIVRVTAGTNATAGWYTIASVTSGVEVVLNATWCTGAVTGGTIVVYHPYTMYMGSGIVSKGAFSIQTNNDTDDYLTFSTAANIPTITATGATYLAFGSDISIGAGKILTTSFIFKELDVNRVCIRNAADDAMGSLYVDALLLTGNLNFAASTQSIVAPIADSDYLRIFAKINAGVSVEVARVANAAAPYFSTGSDQDWKFLASGGAICSADGLPNADPAVAGQLYYIAATGVVMRSAG